MLAETKHSTRPTHLAGKRVVAVVYSSFPADPRPRRAAETLVQEGASVEVICLRESDDEPQHESFNRVEITRVPLKRRRGGKLSYLLQYGSFILLSGVILARRACCDEESFLDARAAAAPRGVMPIRSSLSRPGVLAEPRFVR